MARAGVVFDSATIVVKGHFTPTLFSPAWLLGRQLIGQAEFSDSEVEVISRDLTEFRSGWVRLHSRPDALQLSTSEVEEFDRLRDLAVGMLGTVKETPIGAMGINRAVHFSVDDIDAWHAVGDTLAPKELWQDVLVLPGMRSLSVQGVRPDLLGGWIGVRVEPSMATPGAIFFEHNDHYNLTHVERQPIERTEQRVWESNELPAELVSVDRVDVAIDILKENWTDSMRRAQDVLRALMRIGKDA